MSQLALSLAVVLTCLVLILLGVYALRRERQELREARLINKALAERVKALEQSTLPIAGVDQGEKTWTVTVGGEEVELKAMPALEYARALQELPEFLFMYAKRKEKRENLSEAELETLVERAKRWIEVSSVGEPRLERLTVPEAMHAVVVISRMNGVDGALSTYFRGRLGDSHAGLGGEALRGTPEHAAPS